MTHARVTTGQPDRRSPTRARRLAKAICCAGLLGLQTGCDEQRPANVVVIVVDTLRADHLGAWGYPRDTSPRLDAFARDSVRFAHAYSSAPWTKPSVASMLTGLHPSSHGTQTMASLLPDESDTLAEILGRMGFATAGVVSHSLIARGYNFAQGYERFVQTDARGHDHVSSSSVTKTATRLLDTLSTEERPFFLFVHYFDPHFAYQRHPEFGFSSEGAGRLRGGESMHTLRRLDPPASADEIRFLIDSYDEEIRFTDAAIGELLDALRKRGLYDQSIIVFAADHGEEFYEHGWLGHTRTLYEELINVPLLIRLPGGEASGSRVEEPVSLVALPATIFDALRFDASELELQARSLLPLIREPGRHALAPVYSEVAYDRAPALHPPMTRRSADMRSIVRGREKLIHDRSNDRYELYDLAADPEERDDLAGRQPARLQALQRELDAMTARASPEAPRAAEERTLDDESREQLKQLGYIDE